MYAKQLLLSSSLAAACLARPTMAQEQSTAENSSGLGLEEVVVTAQRREENLQRAAIAIDAVGAEELANAGVSSSPTDLSRLVPALDIRPSAGSMVVLAVRGVGNFAVNPTSDAAIGFAYDGVAISRPYSVYGMFYDLERVEVLKGPQGTLYGRNNTGGAVNVLPQHAVLGEFGGDVMVEAGNYSLRHATGTLNVPLGEVAAVRAAVNAVDRDGYLSSGRNDDEGEGARLQFQFAPSDEFNLQAGADYFHQGGKGPGSVLLSNTTGSPGNLPGITLDPIDGDSTRDFSDPRNCSNGVSPPRFDLSYYYAFDPAACNLRSYNDNTYWGANATVNWTTSLGTLTLIPAHRSSELDQATRAFPSLTDREDHRQDTFEARFASNEDRPFTWLLGAFYQQEDLDAAYTVHFFSAFSLEQQIQQQTRSWAGFGQVRYAFTDELRVSAGARYTHDKKEYTDNQILLMPATADHLSKTWSEATWRAGIEWDVASGSLLFVNVERGYKAGGFVWGGDGYEPEFITAYTVGLKNTFFDRLLFNIELFDYEYKDQQISHLYQFGDSLAMSSFVVDNAGEATIRGAEIEAQYLAVENTLLAASIQYNDATYDKFSYFLGSIGISGCRPVGTQDFGDGTPDNTQYDCSGKQMVYAPKWRVNLGIQQTFPLPDGASLLADLRGYYSSAAWNAAFDYLSYSRSDAYTTGDLALTYASSSKRWRVTAFVNNFTDEEIAASTFGSGGGFLGSPPGLPSPPVVTYAAPRTYGGRVSVRF